MNVTIYCPSDVECLWCKVSVFWFILTYNNHCTGPVINHLFLQFWNNLFFISCFLIKRLNNTKTIHYIGLQARIIDSHFAVILNRINKHKILLTFNLQWNTWNILLFSVSRHSFCYIGCIYKLMLHWSVMCHLS